MLVATPLAIALFWIEVWVAVVVIAFARVPVAGRFAADITRRGMGTIASLW